MLQERRSEGRFHECRGHTLPVLKEGFEGAYRGPASSDGTIATMKSARSIKADTRGLNAFQDSAAQHSGSVIRG